MAAMDSDWLRHFWLLLKNHCMDCHQTCHKCSSNGPAEVLLLFVAIGNPRWPPWTLIGWDIFVFFSRTTAWTITKLTTNVPLVVLKKCWYFLLWSEIQDGHHGLWLAETFSTSSQEPLHGRCTKLTTNVPLVVLKKCCYFLLWSSKMAAMDFAETFSTSSQNHCMEDNQTCHKCSFYGPDYHCDFTTGRLDLPKCSSSGPEEVLILFVVIVNPRMDSDCPETFSTSSQAPLYGWSPNLPQMFLYGPEEVLLLFVVIMKSKMAENLPWTLIFDFF